MKRLFLGLALLGGLLLAGTVVLGQTGTAVNPIAGSVWTYLGPTFGASWVLPPALSIGYVGNNGELAAFPVAGAPGVPGVVRLGYAKAGDVPPLFYTYDPAPCSIPGGDGGSQVPSVYGGCWHTKTSDPAQFGAVPGVYTFYTVTTVAGNPAITLAGGSFTAADVGKWITIQGAGPHTQELRLTTTITAVADATHITVAQAPTQAMESASQIVYYGPAAGAAFNKAMAAGVTYKMPSVFPAGLYMIEVPLQCNVVNYNNANLTAPTCTGAEGGGTHLMAVSDMAASLPDAGALFTVGSTNPDYSGYVRSGYIDGNGMTLDCNFKAQHGFNLPFFKDVTDVSNFTAKNCLTSGMKFGSPMAPSVPAGAHIRHNSISRDIYEIPITNVQCISNQPLVTTAYDHGIPTGRIVAAMNVNNMPGSGGAGEGPIVFVWDKDASIVVNPLRQGVLHGVACSTWGAFSAASNPKLAMNMPSSTIVHRVTNVSAAAQAEVSFITGNYTLNVGDKWCVYGVGGDTTPYIQHKPVPDGCYPVVGKAGVGADGPYKFTVAVDTLSNPFTYTGGGIAFRDMGGDGGTPKDVGILLENTSDMEAHQNFIFGVQYGIYAKPGAGGFDGKYSYNHIYNFPQVGWLKAGLYLGGHNSIHGMQCDPPMVFCGQFLSGGNSSHGSQVTGGGFNFILDNASWLWRLEFCGGCQHPGLGTFSGYADMTVSGDKFFGQSPTLRYNELSNRATAGNPHAFYSLPNYHSFGQLPGNFLLYRLPDSAVGTTKFVAAAIPNPAPVPSPTLIAAGFGGYCSITPMYKTAAEFTISGTIYNTAGGVGNGVYGAIAVHEDNVSPPANNTAYPAGTIVVGQHTGVPNSTLGTNYPISYHGYVEGLVQGKTYWFDLALRVLGAGSAGVADVTCTASEQ